jgi:hypothetical protein
VGQLYFTFTLLNEAAGAKSELFLVKTERIEWRTAYNHMMLKSTFNEHLPTGKALRLGRGIYRQGA